MNSTVLLLKELTEAGGVSGYETPSCQIIFGLN